MPEYTDWSDIEKQKAIWKELDAHSKKLIASEKAGQLVKNVATAPYNIIEQLMSHGYTPGQKDITGVQNVANLSTLLMGTGAARAVSSPIQEGLGVFKPSVTRVGGRKPALSSDMMNTLDKLNEQHQGWGRQKSIINEFRTRYPEFKGNDSTIIRNMYRQSNTKDIELGAFGGKGRLNTESPGESINWLQSQKPVDTEWVKNWAKDAGVVVKEEKISGGKKRAVEKTTYIKLADPDNPDNIATIRIPGPRDQSRHAGFPESPSKAGNFFDTGYVSNLVPRDVSPHTLINQSGQSYANPEALDQALRLKFTKAPYGQNPLVSPDYAPLKPEVGSPTPPKEFKDPRQLKLLSGGYTPLDIINILKQQQGQDYGP